MAEYDKNKEHAGTGKMAFGSKQGINKLSFCRSRKQTVKHGRNKYIIEIARESSVCFSPLLQWQYNTHYV